MAIDFGGYARAKEVFRGKEVLTFYQSEAAKSALMRAQKEITTEGMIVAEPMGEDGLSLTLYHKNADVGREVARILFGQIRELLSERR